MRLNARPKNVLVSAEYKQLNIAFWAKAFEGVLLAAAPITAIYCLLLQYKGSDQLVPIYINIGLFVAIFISRRLIVWPSMRTLYQKVFLYGLRQRTMLLRHMISLPLGAFKKLHKGKVAQSLAEDISALETYFSYVRPQMASDLIMISALFITTILLSWQMALAAGVTFLIGISVLGYLKRSLSRGLFFRSRGMAEAAKHILEFAQGMQIIRVSGTTGAATRDFDKSIIMMRDGFRKSIFRNAPLSSLILSIVTSAVVAAAVVAIFLFDMKDQIVLINFIAALVLLTSIIMPARSFIGASAMTTFTKISHNNIADIEAISGLADGSIGEAPKLFDIAYDNVSFSYNEAEQQVISDISFEAKEGTITAVVGKSGAGKSTLMHLLMRFWDVQSGSISLNKKDIRDYKMETLLDQISTVFQETMLFNDSVINNIRIGRPTASDDEVVRAARSAQILDFIEALPEGMQTIIGVGGSTLSGGEKQRIAIARAILKNAPIIILDEATSALDPENENAIQMAFSNLARHKTVFIIAHRLSTIMNADNILVLDEGKLVEQGTHDKLLETSSTYQSLWSHHNKISDWNIR